MARSEDNVATADHTLSAGRVLLLVVDGEAIALQLPALGSICVGRGSEADLRLVADGVSRRHATFDSSRQGVTLADLGSKNGTHVNGARIGAPTHLSLGDEVRLGEARLQLRSEAEAPAPLLLLRAAFAARLRIELARALAFGRSLQLTMTRLDRSWLGAGLTPTLAGTLEGQDLAGLYDDTTLAIARAHDRAAARSLEQTLARAAAKRGLRGVSASVELQRGDNAEEVLAQCARSLDPTEPHVARDERSRSGPVVASPLMRRLFDEVSKVARGAAPALITGETGAGKEVVAQALHAASQRSGALVSINAAALPEALLESELFGHEKGAFTGASSAKPGLFEQAHKGTLFLDEVGDLPLPMQAKLLRVLEAGLVRRVGGLQELAVDVRIVAATNADLARACAERRFRQDLLFRLNACSLHVPPLRERPEDVVPLAELFLQRACVRRRSPLRFAAETLALLTRYAWPGNVRELRNVIERAALYVEDEEDLVQPAQLTEAVRTNVGPAAAAVGSGPYSVRDETQELERRQIERALAATGGNLTKAAELLGLPRKTLAYRIEKLGVRPPSRR